MQKQCLEVFLSKPSMVWLGFGCSFKYTWSKAFQVMNMGGRLTLNSLDRSPLDWCLWDHWQSCTHSKNIIPTNLLEGEMDIFPGGKQFQELNNASVEQNLVDLPGVPGLGQQVISYLRKERACAPWCCPPPPRAGAICGRAKETPDALSAKTPAGSCGWPPERWRLLFMLFHHYYFIGHALWHLGSQFPDQGLKLRPLR